MGHKLPRHIKRVLLGIIILTLCLVMFVFSTYRQGNEPTVKKKASTAGEKATIAIHNFQQSAVRDGVRQWSMDAESARYMDSDKQAIVKSPIVTFYMNENENENVHLTAHEGILETDTNNIRVSGNVVVKSDAYSLFTEKLNYRNDKRQFTSDTPVQIIGISYRLAADSMWFNLNSDTAVFSGNVKGLLSDKLSL